MLGQQLKLSQQQIDIWYTRYANELRILSRKMRLLHHRMQAGGYGTTFGDVEGEFLYMAVRETKSQICFEISPNAGWSTNYILAALDANGEGVLHTFEIQETFGSRKTREVIIQNLVEPRYQDRLTVHIGDAMKLTETVEGDIGCLLIDSRHDEIFAKWYLGRILPRLKGIALIQDIAFLDQLEKSSEANHVWNWLKQEQIPFQLVGQLETELREKRKELGIVERRPYRCNSIILTWPPGTRSLDSWRELPALDLTERLEEELKHLTSEEAELRLVQVSGQLLHEETHRVNRHREFLRLGKLFRERHNQIETSRCYQIAIALASQYDPIQRRKALMDLFYYFYSNRCWMFLMRTLVMIALEPKSLMLFLTRAVNSMFGRKML